MFEAGLFHLGRWGPRLAKPFFPSVVNRIPLPEAERRIFLTYDDGPSAHLTPAILNCLDHYQAKASFFLCGNQAEKHPEWVRSVHLAGHCIGNHGYDHANPWRTSRDDYIQGLHRTQAVLQDLISDQVQWMRPPYGRITRASAQWCAARNIQLALWDILPGDYHPKVSRKQVIRRVTSSVQAGSIIVLHDNEHSHVQDQALEILHAVLDQLTQSGWQFHALP